MASQVPIIVGVVTMFISILPWVTAVCYSIQKAPAKIMIVFYSIL